MEMYAEYLHWIAYKRGAIEVSPQRKRKVQFGLTGQKSFKITPEEAWLDHQTSCQHSLELLPDFIELRMMSTALGFGSQVYWKG